MPPKEEKLEEEMDPQQEYACCENYRDVNQAKIFMAERRSCELADEFTRLEVQIAIILFGLVGLFSSFFVKDGINLILSGGTFLKISYASIFFLLIASLVFGLIHIKRREIFWEGHHNIRLSRFIKWDEAIKRKTTFKQAMAFHEGTCNGQMNVLSKSPDWTWIMQTISLSLAVVILLVLFLTFLF